MAMLMRGLRGTPVKMLQEKLGLEADGIFGKGTEAALEAYQKKHGLEADGIAGPDTFASLELYGLILLKTGSKGEVVKRVQQALGVDADGKYGPGTARAVSAFQEEKGLEADGVVGPATIQALGIFAPAEEPEAAATPAPMQAAKEVWGSVEETTAGVLEKFKKMLPF